MSDERLLNVLGVAALAATDRMRAAVERELGAGGAAPAALVHLHHHGGASVNDLGRVLGISQPGAVRLVENLVRRQLVRRAAGADRRTHALTLTAQGRRAAESVLAARRSALEQMVGGLDEADRDRLQTALGHLVGTLTEDWSASLGICRLCERRACRQPPGCPLGHLGPEVRQR
jgi:MarR family transcriptional repressor of emrRAB